MNILDFTKELIAKYDLRPNSYVDENPFKNREKYKEHLKESYELETNLLTKYSNRIPTGWYGFDMACCPRKWFQVIEEFLNELEKDSLNYEIFQVKLKFGSVRIYLGNISKLAEQAIQELENVLCDEKLIY